MGLQVGLGVLVAERRRVIGLTMQAACFFVFFFIASSGVVRANTLNAANFEEAVALGVSKPLASEALRYIVELQWRLNGDNRPANHLNFVNLGVVARCFQIHKEDLQGFFGFSADRIMQIPYSVAVSLKVLFDLCVVRCMMKSFDDHPIRSLVLWLECVVPLVFGPKLLT